MPQVPTREDAIVYLAARSKDELLAIGFTEEAILDIAELAALVKDQRENFLFDALPKEEMIDLLAREAADELRQPE